MQKYKRIMYTVTTECFSEALRRHNVMALLIQ